MKYDKSITEIIMECSKILTEIGKSPFSRQDIIKLFKWKYPDANPDSINPMIQGLTDNLEGGAPGAINKYFLHSVEKGLFVINEELDK